MIIIVLGLIAYYIYKVEFASRRNAIPEKSFAEIEREQRQERLEQCREYTRYLEEEREAMVIRREQKNREDALEENALKMKKLKHKFQMADRGLDRYIDRINDLYALLDMVEMEWSACVSGSKEQRKHQKAIVTLKNQIATAEDNYEKAKYNRDIAYTELWA